MQIPTSHNRKSPKTEEENGDIVKSTEIFGNEEKSWCGSNDSLLKKI